MVVVLSCLEQAIAIEMALMYSLCQGTSCCSLCVMNVRRETPRSTHSLLASYSKRRSAIGVSLDSAASIFPGKLCNANCIVSLFLFCSTVLQLQSIIALLSLGMSQFQHSHATRMSLFIVKFTRRRGLYFS